MGGYPHGFINPDSSPSVTPSGKDLHGTTDLMLIIKSVTDQGHSLGKVSAEVSQLKDVIASTGVDLREVRDKSIRVESQLLQIDKTLLQLTNQVEKGFAELARSIEKANERQTELLDLKLAPIVQSFGNVDLKLEPIKLASQQISGDLKKVEASVEELKSFRWKFGGALVVIAVIASALVTYLLRTLPTP